MTAIFTFLATRPELLTFLLVGIGSVVGLASIRGVALGSAAVLFLAIAFSAWAKAAGVDLAIPGLVANVGLALFCFAVGISSGASFFHALRRSTSVLAVSFFAICFGGVVAFALAKPFGLTLEQAAGTYAGGVTNTPALVAAGGSAEATVGYSVAYIFGVIGVILVINLALRKRHEDADTPSPLISLDVRVERTDEPTIGDLEAEQNRQINITRIRRTESGPSAVPADTDVLQVGDVVTVDGAQTHVEAAATALGHRSSHRLVLDRRYLDFRRVTISQPAIVGIPISDLKLEETYNATIARVRRGDVDMVANPQLVLQLGDRVRVVAPRDQIPVVSAYLGDSSRGMSNINPAALGIGMALGFALGSITFPSPSGASVSLGGALGCLIVGLVMGYVGRVGTVITTLPFTASTVLSEFGLLLFLAQAGVKGGSMVTQAFVSGTWLRFVGLGACVTLGVALVTYFGQRSINKMGGLRLSGTLAGTQSHPALLSYANGRTDFDFRVSDGYTTVYPLAMITKIVVGTVLGMFL